MTGITLQQSLLYELNGHFKNRTLIAGRDKTCHDSSAQVGTFSLLIPDELGESRDVSDLPKSTHNE
jgi:hypothetical protein